MSFGRKGAGAGAGESVTGEIDLAGAAHLLQGSREFLRMWHRPGGPATCMVNPTALGADPATFGIALVDCTRHGARAWANATGVTEAEALARIWLGIDAERGLVSAPPRDTPTDLGKEIR
jgi:hypothetical protein